jgi:hypothetical protein
VVQVTVKNNPYPTYKLIVDGNGSEKIWYNDTANDNVEFGYQEMTATFAWDSNDSHWLVSVSQTPLSGTWSGSLDMTGTLKVDTISEHTSAAGVTIDGVLLKDNGITASGNISFDGGTFVFNESGADKDFRIEGVSDAYLFATDASDKTTAVGTAPESALKLIVKGNGATSATSALSIRDSAGAGYFLCRNDKAVFTNSGAIDGALSDIRLKKDFEPIEDALPTILALNPTFFKWKHPEFHTDDKIAGFVAQEVQAVKPTWVQQGNLDAREADISGVSPEEVLTTKFADLTAYLVKAIQEQQAQIEQLKAEVAAMKGV